MDIRSLLEIPGGMRQLPFCDPEGPTSKHECCIMNRESLFLQCYRICPDGEELWRFLVMGDPASVAVCYTRLTRFMGPPCRPPVRSQAMAADGRPVIADILLMDWGDPLW